jgi:glutamate-1-semialdehyde 2,1-aminomutase
MANFLNFSASAYGPAIQKAEGHHVYDVTGKKFLDFGFGAGVNILGHSNLQLTEASKKYCDDGVLHTYKHAYLDTWLDAIRKFVPATHHNFVLASTGTEANYRALRYSRAVTDKVDIVRFSGSWHGMNEWLLFDNGSRFNVSDKHMRQGIPEFISSATHTLKFGSLDSLDYLEKNHKKIASVFVEPVMGCAPILNLSYLEALIKLCRNYKIITIFDEMITGFRVHKNGVSSMLKMAPDIIVYGKILGGGYPIGLVSVSDHVYKIIKENYSGYFSAGGTYSANPLVMRISADLLNILATFDYQSMNNLAEEVRCECNTYFKMNNYPLSLVGVDSMTRLAFTREKFIDREEREYHEIDVSLQSKYKSLMLDYGIIWPNNGLIFTSLISTRSHIGQLIDSVKKASKSTFG